MHEISSAGNKKRKTSFGFCMEAGEENSPDKSGETMIDTHAIAPKIM